MMSKASRPTMPNTAVKIVSISVLPKATSGEPQPRMSAADAGDGQVGSVTKAGDVLFVKPQQAN